MRVLVFFQGPYIHVFLYYPSMCLHNEFTVLVMLKAIACPCLYHCLALRLLQLGPGKGYFLIILQIKILEKIHKLRIFMILFGV